MKAHPLAAIFPPLDEASAQALANDIQLRGLLHPIVLLDGAILDGVHRYRACQQAGVEPRFEEYNGPDPAGYVISINLHRRHLPPGVRAGIVAAAQNWSLAQNAGRPITLPYGRVSTVAERATVAGVGERTQARADRIARADPELARKVAHGEVSLQDAVEKATGRRPGRGEQKPAASIERITQLEAEIERVRDGAAEAVAMAETAREVLDGDAAKTILQLREQLRLTEQRRDELMRENAELIREVKRLRRKLGEQQ